MNKNYRPTWAQIKLDHLEENYRNLRALVAKDKKFCAIIKANGYGHGSVTLARYLEEWGCDYFGVATPCEALELRKGGIRQNLMCLGYVPSVYFEALLKANVDIPLYSLAEAEKLEEIAASISLNAKVHIKLDSGMSRLGLPCTKEGVEEAAKIAALPHLHMQGLFSHFARADEKQQDTTKDQVLRYEYAKNLLQEKGVDFDICHICNSAGTIYYPQYHMDMVRVGISLYGYYPSEDVDKNAVALKPVMSLKTTISHLKDLEQGRGISYGHRYIVESPREKIATVPVGYADGFTRMLNGKATADVAGRKVPVVGSICMDQSLLKLPEDLEVKVGDEVTLFSDEEGFGADSVAQKLGTISYEIICMIQRRIPRVYTYKGEEVSVMNYLLDERE